MVAQHVFTAVLRVTEQRFLADAAIMGNMVRLQRKKEKGSRRRASHRRGGKKKEEEEAQKFWGMLYADDAGIVSRSPGGLERMLTMIVTACSTFGITVSEAKTEIMRLQPKCGGKVSFTATAPCQICERSKCVYLSGAISEDRELGNEITRRQQRAWACF